ncbi:TetR/AcrR family transcriptional regulator [Sphingomonas sp. NPDC079357]|uniref:TetR/AcrR family transcriptional regulator n=1 Tax=Sphingomonas sp. NPDC079357 TaxID=3364518 RepID=UPI003850C5B7
MVPSAGLRDTLLDHAIAMLEAGEAEPGIRALARAAGVSAMAPYRHFADKAALLAAVAERGFAMFLDALSAADAEGSDAERLVAQGGAYVAFACAHPALFRAMFACGAGTPKQPDAPAFSILTGRVAALVGEDDPVSALGCWAIVHGLATLALDGGVPLAPEQVRAVLRTYVAGIVAGAQNCPTPGPSPEKEG